MVSKLMICYEWNCDLNSSHLSLYLAFRYRGQRVLAFLAEETFVVQYPTDPLTILGPQGQEIGEF